MYGLEMGMPADTGAAISLSRLAYVGLGSKAWGELTAGRQYTHTFHTYAVGSAHAYGTFASSYGWSSIATRASNSIKYSSPVFSGFSAGAIWSPSGANAGASGANNIGEPGNAGVATTGKASYWDAAVRYTPGPFGVAASYAKNKTEPFAATSVEVKMKQLAANFDNKQFGVYGVWAKADDSSVGGGEVKVWSISPVARFGAHELYGLYGRFKASDPTGSAQAKTYGIVYENVMSKRTRAYVGYGKTKNDAGLAVAPTNYAAAPAGQFAIGAAGGLIATTTNVAAGTSPSAVQVGVVHTF